MYYIWRPAPLRGEDSYAFNPYAPGFGVTHGCLCGRGVNPSSGGKRRPNSGGGNDGGSVWLPPPPTLAEIQHALEQAEITKPVPRPTTKPGVSQDELNKQRDKVEKNVKAATGNDNSSDIIAEIGNAFTPTTDRVAYSPVTGAAGKGGGKGGGGPPASASSAEDGCEEEDADCITLYHGTDEGSAQDIRENGIDLSKVESGGVDFGRGFYTTRNSYEAADYANMALSEGKLGDFVKFRVPRNFFDQYRGRVFGASDSSFANLVRQMRTGGPMHSYDWLEGPVTNNPKVFLEGGPLSAGGNQISFHTPEIVQALSRFIVR